MIVLLFVLVFLLAKEEIAAKASAEAEAIVAKKTAAKKAAVRRFRHARIGRMGRRIH